MDKSYIKFIIAYDYADKLEELELACDEAYELAEKIADEYKDDYKDWYDIELDNGDILYRQTIDDFEVDRYEFLPMWGTMWQFNDSCDDYWLEERNGLQAMSECGFRIYYSEEFGYFFGIDGCGYDFYEAHWIPLYEARGLKWHEGGEE